MEKYYLGLDIGTDSVGWAVTNKNYNVPKFKGNAMWGIRLFDEGNTAQERRSFRASRRRLERRRDRLDLLELLFCDEIAKKDKEFFIRLKESNLYLDDKSSKFNYSLFNDENFTDKDYYKLYPTIYHLRKALIQENKEFDVRLVFLALHNIIKNRGHFLFDTLNMTDIESFQNCYSMLDSYLTKNNIGLNCTNLKEFEEVLKDSTLCITAKCSNLQKLCNITKKENPQLCAIISMICGAKVKMSLLFNNEEYSDTEAKTFSFKDANYEENEDKYRSIIGDEYELIDILKALYDWSVLANILNFDKDENNKYLSFAKVKIYDTHKRDLKLLKKYVREDCSTELYNKVFKENSSGLNNYVAYSGHTKKNGKTDTLNCKKITQLDFCDFLKKLLPKTDKSNYQDMFSRIELGTFMPKAVTKDNSIIPMQVHRMELIAILNNAKRYLPFLNTKDNDGITLYDKIISLFDYRIPYYVGPLNNNSKYSWVVRKEGKIYPWNINSIVDMQATAEAFITNLTSKCTYIPTKDVIPKNSLLYSKYTVLNELNNLTLNGEKISVKLKQDIYTNLFMCYNKVTQKILKNYLSSIGIKDALIGGIDNDFKSSLKPWIALKSFSLTTEESEDIIKAITIFSEDKKLLKKRITNKFGNKLSTEQINSICKLKFSGWSRLSREFLTEIESVNPVTGEILNIISTLWETNDNLMVLLGSSYKFAESLQNYVYIDPKKSLRQIVENMYVSPKVKRPIYQSLKITNEVVKTEKKPPVKIFIEMARGPEEEKKRTVSRKNKLLEIYKAIKKDEQELYNSLDKKSEDDLRRDKLYFYYTQMGKCMYTGESIDLDKLLDSNLYYDIDHIFPQSKVKDDSLDNRVLVKKTTNAFKNNVYPLSKDIREKRYTFWKMLKEKELISEKKFNRLVRSTPLTDDELSDFISRQLVETRQSTKAVADVLKQLYPNTEIVYVKAGLVSEFRKEYDLLKCREVNDLHHAKDAYLNIVVGNVYNTKYTHNKAIFIKQLQSGEVSLNKMFSYPVKDAWKSNNFESLKAVKQQMSKNNILFTRYSFVQSSGEKCGLFKQTILKKGMGQVPIKGKEPFTDIEKYGGYDKPTSTYFSLVEYDGEKDKKVRALIPIDLYQVVEFEKNPNNYLEKTCGLTNPKVLIKCIKYNSIISFDDFKMHISSKSGGGSTIVYKPAMQLVLDYNSEKYVKAIQKYLDKYSYREPNEFDKLSREENIKLYQQLYTKMCNTIFKIKFKNCGEKLKNNEHTFISLSIKDQCFTLSELLKIMHCNVVTGDLTKVGLAKKSGTVTSNSHISDISSISSIKLINQSITGLYSKQVELLQKAER